MQGTAMFYMGSLDSCLMRQWVKVLPLRPTYIGKVRWLVPGDWSSLFNCSFLIPIQTWHIITFALLWETPYIIHTTAWFKAVILIFTMPHHQLDLTIRGTRHSHRPTNYIVNDGHLIVDERSTKHNNTVIYNARGSTMWVNPASRHAPSAPLIYETHHHYPSCRGCSERRYLYSDGYCCNCYTVRYYTREDRRDERRLRGVSGMRHICWRWIDLGGSMLHHSEIRKIIWKGGKNYDLTFRSSFH